MSTPFVETYAIETDPPPIDAETRADWQILIDDLAVASGCPAALIMRVDEDRIAVDTAARGDAHPYRVDAAEELGSGLYCEDVMARRALLHVPDALADPSWRDNPDIALGMISYAGLPLQWPNGRVFGTICVLDRSPIKQPDQVIGMLGLARHAAQMSLKAAWRGAGRPVTSPVTDTPGDTG